MTSYWKDKTILITGAGSGIGQALAELFASHGARLVLTDINAENLEQTASRILPAVALTRVADAGDQDDWRALAKDIATSNGYLDVLINNAGMCSYGYFNETSKALFDKVLSVNLNGVVTGCREMLPLLEKSTRGLIVNVASIFGIVTIPMLAPYHASKFAVRGFSEALKQDFRFQGKNVDVVCVIPGGIRTNIANYSESDSNKAALFASNFDRIAKTTPMEAAKVIEKGMRKKQTHVYIGADARLINWLQRLLPQSYSHVINLLFGVSNMIDQQKN